MSSSDAQIVKSCLKGDARQQRALYQKYRVNLFVLCLRYASHRAEAEDFLQDGFVKIFQDLHQFDSNKGSLSAWTRRVVLNVVFQHLRKKRIEYSSTPVEDFANQFSSTEDVLAQMSAQELMQVIQQLPEGYRIVFNMYIVDGYTHKEIAAELGISESTSKSQLHKAKTYLKRQLKATYSHIDK
ncbi:MAG: sigma-70 family RNA polymerase sigma factor [Bacteroidota bacterium]